jgi:hypothetical protein
MEELEKMDEAVDRQWQMRISRCEYEAQLAEKRYMEVDPSNRLVASTLEQRWNDALVKLEESKHQYEAFQKKEKEFEIPTPEEREKVIALAQNFPLLWNAPMTSTKDKKRILRLLIKDISIKKVRESNEVILQIRWQGGTCESLSVEISTEHLKYSEKFVEKVRQLAKEHSDAQIASILSEEGHLSCKGKALRPSMINWIRNQHKIPLGLTKSKNELSVMEVSERFNISKHVVYYWIDCGILKTRQLNGRSSQHWITIDSQKEKELLQYIKNSSRLQKLKK